MLNNTLTTDEDELYRVALLMSDALLSDFIEKPYFVVKGCETFERAFKQLEEETEVLINDDKNLDRILGTMRQRVVEPLNKIKSAVTAIQEGRDYNPLRVSAAFGCFIYGYIELRSRALEYRKERIADE
ncbi:MAG: hypothetical protein V1802_03130 [Candidatus Aenigmatarchaeota archaeon]